ncbi:MAG: hypothetical protein OXF73_10055 [Gammaproteobacteria bacterium]|nr:hypothetical protein [Gammaproteobacteria bacterium]
MNESINRGLDNRVWKVEEQNHELSERISVLEEKMNTSYERLRADMAKRENRLIITILGGLAVATTVLGLLIAGIPAA